MVNEDQFRKACGAFPTGVAIVTFAIDDTDVHGITISSFTSVSLRPPLILFCIHQQSRILPVLRCSQHFCINILTSDHELLSTDFAKHHSSARFPVEWRRGPTGSPTLTGALATLECSVKNVIPGGDHEIVLGEVVAASVASGAPLVRFQGSYCNLSLVQTPHP